jgi:hypothetical protein
MTSITFNQDNLKETLSAKMAEFYLALDKIKSIESDMVFAEFSAAKAEQRKDEYSFMIDHWNNIIGQSQKINIASAETIITSALFLMMEMKNKMSNLTAKKAQVQSAANNSTGDNATPPEPPLSFGLIRRAFDRLINSQAATELQDANNTRDFIKEKSQYFDAIISTSFEYKSNIKHQKEQQNNIDYTYQNRQMVYTLTEIQNIQNAIHYNDKDKDTRKNKVVLEFKHAINNAQQAPAAMANENILQTIKKYANAYIDEEINVILDKDMSYFNEELQQLLPNSKIIVDRRNNQDNNNYFNNIQADNKDKINTDRRKNQPISFSIDSNTSSFLS